MAALNWSRCPAAESVQREEGYDSRRGLCCNLRGLTRHRDGGKER